MKEYQINGNEAGQRFDKYLHKVLKEAGSSFLYKMLRKKNITLNGKKADGTERLTEGDIVKIFLADETFAKFAGEAIVQENIKELNQISGKKLDVVYEDDDILVINKPSGMLSQKAEAKDVSANEYILAYLMEQGTVTEESIKTFKPSVCNRLDRNTSGLLIAGKSLHGLQTMSEALKERSLKKYYRCIVKGKMTKSQKITGYLSKNEKTNKVSIYDKPVGDSKYIETEYEPIEVGENDTLLEVHLITGRSHQIRAHLASIGHPIAGDVKYGNRAWNEELKKKYHIQSQMLHAYRVEFADGKKVVAPVPKEFTKFKM